MASRFAWSVTRRSIHTWGSFVARPTKLDPDRIDRLVQAIQLGATYSLACKYAGISHQTLLNWLAKGEAQKTGPAHDLVARVAEAEGRAVVGWLVMIEKAAKDGDWRAALAKLERRYPETYGRQVIEHRDPDMNAMVERLIHEKQLDDEHAANLRDFVAERAKRRSA